VDTKPAASPAVSPKPPTSSGLQRIKPEPLKNEDGEPEFVVDMKSKEVIETVK